MQNLKQKLIDQGLVGTLTLRENGTTIKLRFGRGETKKLGKLSLGPVNMDVELCLEEIPGVAEGSPNLMLVIHPVNAFKERESEYTKVGNAAHKKALAEGKTPEEAGVLARAAAHATLPPEPKVEEKKVEETIAPKVELKVEEKKTEEKVELKTEEKVELKTEEKSTPKTDEKAPEEPKLPTTTTNLSSSSTSSGGKNKSR